MRDEKRLKLPTNIKQVGNISHGLKIYVEDYVYTYIQQYASFAESEEKIGVLTGKKEFIENEDVLFINGIIQGKFSKNEAGMEVLTEKSKGYIKEEMIRYFPDDEILGWLYIQPGYGDFLNSTLINYHEKNFKKYYSVLFIYDPIEKINGFFSKNEVLGGLEEVKGYFIYYDRNEGMHEYMLQNKFAKPKEAEAYFEDDIEIRDTSETAETVENTGDMENELHKDEIVEKIRNSFTKERAPNPRTVRRKGKVVTEQKKLVNLLGTLSAALFCACFVMGASIIRNDDRIDNVEKQMAAMDNSYTYLMKTIKEGNVQNVFAAQNGESLKTENSSSIKPKEEPTKIYTTVTEEKTTEKTTETTTKKTTETTTKKTTEKPTKTTEKNIKTSAEKTKYVVKEGDSLTGISIKFYGTNKKTKEIMAENNIDDPDKIYYGMVLRLP